MNPLIIFSLIWISQLIGHLIFLGDFEDFYLETFFIFISGIASFFGAWIFVGLFFIKSRSCFVYHSEATPLVNFYIKYISLFYLILYILPEVFRIILMMDVSEYREYINKSVINKNYNVIIGIYMNYLFIVFNIFVFSYADKINKKWMIYLFIVGLLACLLTLGRTMLLLYFISISSMLMMLGVFNKKKILGLFFLFLVIFFSMAIFMKKGGSESFVDALVWNFKVYFLSGVAAFNNYVINSDPVVEGYILIPKYISWFISIIGFDFEVANLVYPFVEIPYPTNVYTVFFPWYHDFGYFGVLFGLFGIGFISAFFYFKRFYSRYFMFFYSLSLYPLIMTIFDEQYLNAYILWVMVVFCILLDKIYNFVFLNRG